MRRTSPRRPPRWIVAGKLSCDARARDARPDDDDIHIHEKLPFRQFARWEYAPDMVPQSMSVAGKLSCDARARDARPDDDDIHIHEKLPFRQFARWEYAPDMVPQSMSPPARASCRNAQSARSGQNGKTTRPTALTNHDRTSRIQFCVSICGPLAQLAEQGTFNPKVAGSIPSRPTTFFPVRVFDRTLTLGYLCVSICGPLAQLAEQGTFNPKVAGSIPSRPTTFFPVRVFDRTLTLGYRPTAGLWFLVPAI